MFDGVQMDLNHTLFTYADDPVISRVHPATSFITFVYLYPLVYVGAGTD